MYLKEILGVRAHTHLKVINWCPHGFQRAKSFYSKSMPVEQKEGWHPPVVATRWHGGFALPLRNVCHKVAFHPIFPVSAHLPQSAELVMGTLGMVVHKSQACYVLGAAISVWLNKDWTYDYSCTNPPFLLSLRCLLGWPQLSVLQDQWHLKVSHKYSKMSSPWLS